MILSDGEPIIGGMLVIRVDFAGLFILVDVFDMENEPIFEILAEDERAGDLMAGLLAIIGEGILFPVGILYGLNWISPMSFPDNVACETPFANGLPCASLFIIGL